MCKLRGNPHVELEHWLQQLLQAADGDLHRIARHFELDLSRLAADLTAALDRLPRGATSVSDLSPHIENAVERGWVYASLMYGAAQVRSGHLLVGMLKTSSLRGALLNISRQFERITPDTLTEHLAAIVAASPEAAAMAAGAAGAGTAPAPAQLGKQEALTRYAVDLSARARAGQIDPVTGRDEEIRLIIDILMRRRQNNPILTGEAGVGKTAVVEGLALRIARGDVPPALRDVSLFTLDLGLLQAGASMRGEFESRLRQVIDEVQASPKPIILFIDEAHTLIGAGGAAGTGDAANLLKPALARGTLRTIAATTWSEYKKYFEKDPALTRRFQVVQVVEPDEEKAIRMLRGIAGTLERHHRVQLLDEAIEAAVRLSHRYIPARQLPDKAVSLLDTSCARVAISQHATPAEVEDSRRRIEALDTELEIIGREAVIGIDVSARRAAAQQAGDAERARFAVLEQRWRDEKTLVDQLLALRARLRDGGHALDAAPDQGQDQEQGQGQEQGQAAADARAALLEQLHAVEERMVALRGETPLIMASVNAQTVSSVVADWTGIPVGRMVDNELGAVLNLADTLSARVIGQRHGLDMIARRIQTSRARLDNPDKPVGVFLLCGPSGVGKTETGLALAEALYGGEHNVITINMSEFQERHSVSTLKGAPPGYVGYGEGGILTEAVRRKPYSVVLLDEVEKAHPDVHELFFQVFDKGWMEDAEGRYIDFRNTLILLTSNVGTEMVMSLCQDPALMPDPAACAQALREPLLKVFPAALLGRLVVVPYFPLSDAVLADIIRLQLGRIAQRIAEQHQVLFHFDDAVVGLIGSRCNEVESGARVVDALLTNTMLPQISEQFLIRILSGTPFGQVSVGVRDGDFDYAFD